MRAVYRKMIAGLDFLGWQASVLLHMHEQIHVGKYQNRQKECTHDRNHRGGWIREIHGARLI